jgi:serine/threonine protein kinase
MIADQSNDITVKYSRFDRLHLERVHRMLPIASDTLLQQRYRILNLLGEGKFGRTYLAADRGRSDAYCAIEELAPFSQFSSAVTTAKATFKQEATILYQLQHPQLPRFWTTFEEQNRILLVRDYVIGKTYRNLLDERRDRGKTFSEAEVWRFLLQVIPVIGYIHGKGTIHRDLSPEHIVCRDSDHLPVPIDFGVVKEFASKLQVDPDQPRLAIGQPGYAPSEQLHSGQVYPSSDLYALAVTAIVLLTGKEPSALFEGNKMNWVWRTWTPISDGFAQILSRMLDADPQNRYQSAIEVDRDLQSLQISEPQAPLNPVQYPPVEQSRSTIPTVVVGSKESPSINNRVQTAITNLNVKSIWEKPQFFIPIGILISLLAGFGSWFAVIQFRNNQSVTPVATTPPKQIDFNNPTIPTDNSSPSLAAADLIQLEMDRAVEKEGKVDANTPARYRIAAVAGQNLDIQLVPTTAQGSDPRETTLPTNPLATPLPDPKSKTAAIPVAKPLVATQVLMTIISPSGAPIDEKADRVVGWRGQISTSGDYTIELKPIAGLVGGAFPFKLSVTQLSVTPGTETPPANGSTSPLGIPLPMDRNGINPSPANPESNSPDSTPTFTPVPVPIEVPTAKPSPTAVPERPTRTRRRNRINPDETPTPRRSRRNQVESTTEEVVPTPRRNRTRRQQAAPAVEPKQSTVTTPDLGDNLPNNTPTPEESIGIPVPPAKTATPPPTQPEANQTQPPASGDIDTE